MDQLNYISVIKQQILMVKTCQLTTKCKGNKVICLKCYHSGYETDKLITAAFTTKVML